MLPCAGTGTWYCVRVSSGVAGGMEGSHRAAEAQHCGKTGEVQSADAACGAVTVPRLKESRRKAEAP